MYVFGIELQQQSLKRNSMKLSNEEADCLGVLLPRVQDCLYSFESIYRYIHVKKDGQHVFHL